MKNFFITGTDTNVGKTVVAAIMTKLLGAHYWKPIQSGIANEGFEQHTLQQLTGLPQEHFLPSIYALKLSLSPHQAAAMENIEIDLDQCIVPNHFPLIVEGAGGVYVPLNHHQCILDLIQKTQFPVIIVARGTLGTINHTLLTIEALRHRNIAIKGIVFSGELNLESQAIIEQWGKVITLFHVPYMPNLNHMQLMNWLASQETQILSRLI